MNQHSAPRFPGLPQADDPPEHYGQLSPGGNSSEGLEDLTIWNDTAEDFPRENCLHQLFEIMVELMPQATAIIYQDQIWTYQQLNRRANQLAHHLRSLGVAPETRVGICLERTPEILIGLFGILKAGGAYVPLDPAYPAERLAFMLRDAQARVLLTQQHLLTQDLKNITETLYLECGQNQFSQESESNSLTTVTPANLAYVIYTSGSTGQPKGVAISHAGVVNNVIDLNHRFGINERDRILALSSLSFDMSVYELLGVLCAGGAVVLPEIEYFRDPGQWSQLLLAQEVSLWSSAPALLQMLLAFVEEKPQKPFLSLRLALLAGDWIPVTMPFRLQAIAPAIQVMSLGGATEVSIYSTTHLVDASDATRQSIPYGKPMANQQAYILDEQLRPVPPGTPGELCFGGAGLARGYFHRPDLTAEKFVPHPLSQEKGARLYRTGDLARYQTNGELELLGRIDHQVKIRGLRVELGEIEAVLKQYPGIDNAIVALHEDTSATKCLVAYLVPGRSIKLDLDHLKKALQKTLPSHMVPGHFSVLETLPLLPSGKVNRLELPWPLPNRIEPARLLIPPRTPLEEVVQQLWMEITGFTEVSVEDRFFETGGDSLQAMKLLTRLHEIFPLDLPLRSFLKAFTVAEVATLIEEMGQSAQIDVLRIAHLALQLNRLSEEETLNLLKARKDAL